MRSLTQELVNFVVKTEYEDLPQSVIHESKRILLDAVGCALAGLSSDKGKVAVKLATRMAGPPESTIIGLGEKVSSCAASFANGELINALDWDAALAGHNVASVVPALLALAESGQASGKRLILAIALGIELAVRLGQAVSHTIEVVKEGPDKGKAYFPPVYGFGHYVLPGSLAAGKILNLDQERMSHAMGIAGYICPVPPFSKWARTLPLSMTKYSVTGWISQAEVTSALLAEAGYTGDPTVLDGEYGFGRFYHLARWEPDTLTQKLGEQWHMLGICYKEYPCCRFFHSGLDCFMKIIEEQNLLPRDIDQVRLWLTPVVDLPLCTNREIRTQIDAQFSTAYIFAVAAHRIKFIDWQDLDTIQNPEIRDFMNKVIWQPYPDWGKLVLEDPRRFPAKAEVVSGEKRFEEENLYPKRIFSITEFGSVPEEARTTDEELIKKFRSSAFRVLPWGRIDEAIECIFELEELENISLLTKLVSL